MANRIRIKSGSDSSYEVTVGKGVLGSTVFGIDTSSNSHCCAIVDPAVNREWHSYLSSSLPGIEIIEAPNRGEALKSQEEVSKLWGIFSDHKLDRKSMVIAIGGGALLDACGFAASTYMRGIPTINVPTTLLSQVDSSVGGKTGINFSGQKNLIGTFHNPGAVIIDTRFLTSLHESELSSGMAEIIKHALIAKPELVEFLELRSAETLFQEGIEEVITESIALKASIVERDPTETGERKLLNFGHTIGHALESLSSSASTPLLHGHAVSLGMVGASYISKEVFGFYGIERVKSLLRKYGLPIQAPPFDKEEVVRLIARDKKAFSGRGRWTLLQEFGNAVFDCEVPSHIVLNALGELI